MKVKTACRHFKGDIPCQPHKEYGVHCSECAYYEKIDHSILIIKLGAAGDVIRTTPILHKISKEFPKAEITWLTDYPEFVPKRYVQNILAWNLQNVIWLQNREFDLLLNLDKDKPALGLAESVQAEQKIGYLPNNTGKCVPADENAKYKWLTGLFDDVNRKNTKSYPQEIFEICDWKFNQEKYILELPTYEPVFELSQTKKIIGLNTGCGTRWQTRLWGEENWQKLADSLAAEGFLPLLLGGKQEDELNRRIAAASPAVYLGAFSLANFIHLVNRCSLVVTSVTMTMHIAIALEKRLVVLNNIFNKNEFEMYGLGKILEPDKPCLGCYRNSCPEPCLKTISPQTVLQAIEELL